MHIPCHLTTFSPSNKQCQPPWLGSLCVAGGECSAHTCSENWTGSHPEKQNRIERTPAKEPFHLMYKGTLGVLTNILEATQDNKLYYPSNYSQELQTLQIVWETCENLSCESQ